MFQFFSKLKNNEAINELKNASVNIEIIEFISNPFIITKSRSRPSKSVVNISKPTINVLSRKSIVPERIVDISIKVRKFTDIVKNFNMGTTNMIEVESSMNVKRVYRNDVGRTTPEKREIVKKKIKIYRNRFLI